MSEAHDNHNNNDTIAMTSSNHVQDFTYYQEIKDQLISAGTSLNVPFTMDEVTRVAMKDYIEAYPQKIAKLLPNLPDVDLRKVLQSSLIV